MQPSSETLAPAFALNLDQSLDQDQPGDIVLHVLTLCDGNQTAAAKGSASSPRCGAISTGRSSTRRWHSLQSASATPSTRVSSPVAESASKSASVRTSSASADALSTYGRSHVQKTPRTQEPPSRSAQVNAAVAPKCRYCYLWSITALHRLL